MDIISAIPGQLLWLGFQGENKARAVTFDFSAWAQEFPGGTLTLAYIPPGHETAYPMEVLTTGTMGTWTLTNAVTQYAGYGWALWSYRRASDGLVVKTCKCQTHVTPMPDASGDTPPEPQQGWVEQVLNAGAVAQEAAERAEASLDKLPYPNLETGTWWRYNSETGEYEDTGAAYSSNYIYQQTTAAAVWEINHNLVKYPSVTTVDSAGNVVVGDVRYIDANSLTVTFAGAFSGTAYLN